MSHRRGLSLDTRRQQISPTTTARQSYRVSTTTNPGLVIPPQHILREAQQQRIARPGHGQPTPTTNHFTINQADSENFLLSPHGTPQSQRFVDAMAGGHGQMQDVNAAFDAYIGPMNAIVKKNSASYAQSNTVAPGQDFELFGPDSALSTPTFMNFHEANAGANHPGWISEGEIASSHSRRTSRRISNGILEKVARFEALGNGMEGVSGSRPMTPPNQNAQSTYGFLWLGRLNVSNQVARLFPPYTT